MILTCPECATSYFVDDGRIPRRGRTVKCSSCGARWKALPEGVVEEEPEPPAPRPVTIPEPQDDPEDEIDFVAGPITPVRKAKPKSNRGLIVGVVFVGVLVVGGAATVAFRQQIAGLVPATGAVFAAVGLPVNTVGLSFENVASKPILVDGRPVMAVTGSIRNNTKAAIDAPPIHLSLVDKDKASLLAYDLKVANPRVPPGGVRHFAWNLPDPPAGALGLEIGFNPRGKADTALPHAAAVPVAEPVAAPVEAQSLPADSPDALTKHE